MSLSHFCCRHNKNCKIQMNHSLNVVLHLNKIKATESFFFILKKKYVIIGLISAANTIAKKKKSLQFDIYSSPKTTYSHKWRVYLVVPFLLLSSLILADQLIPPPSNTLMYTQTAASLKQEKADHKSLVKMISAEYLSCKNVQIFHRPSLICSDPEKKREEALWLAINIRWLMH